MLFLPLISVVYGGFLPAGLFIYWITATIIQIFQQYLILGWGSMFPLFGWYPEFARDHQPRFPVKMPEIQPPKPGQPSAPERAKPVDTDISAAEPQEIARTQVLQTWVAGKKVWDRSASRAAERGQ